MRISDWSSDVCSSDLIGHDRGDDVRAKLAHGIERFVRRPIEFWRNAKKRLIIAFEGNSNDHLFFPYMNTGSRSSAIDRSTATGVSLSRSEERRVGKECVSTFSSRWSPSH